MRRKKTHHNRYKNERDVLCDITAQLCTVMRGIHESSMM